MHQFSVAYGHETPVAVPKRILEQLQDSGCQDMWVPVSGALSETQVERTKFDASGPEPSFRNNYLIAPRPPIDEYVMMHIDGSTNAASSAARHVEQTAGKKHARRFGCCIGQEALLMLHVAVFLYDTIVSS